MAEPKPHTEGKTMDSHTFTGLWPQTAGNPLVTFEWEGTSPVDALVRQWATCLPDTVMSSPLRCETDGHAYHLALDEHGQRQIKVVAVAEQFTAKSLVHPIGATVSTIVHSIGGRSETVTGEVVGHRHGHVRVRTAYHGTLAVEPAKLA